MDEIYVMMIKQIEGRLIDRQDKQGAMMGEMRQMILHLQERSEKQNIAIGSLQNQINDLLAQLRGGEQRLNERVNDLVNWIYKIEKTIEDEVGGEENEKKLQQDADALHHNVNMAKHFLDNVERILNE